MDYNQDERALIWLDSFDGLTLRKKMSILEYFESPSEFYDRFFDCDDILVPIITKPLYEKMALAHSEQFINQYINNLNKKNIVVLTILSKGYPELLAQIHMPPLLLYCKGDITLLSSPCLAIVGTRVCTSYGADMAKKFAKVLCENGMTIVSGLASGIDTYAHESTIAHSGKAIAVFAGGFEHIYPAENENLVKEIEKTGLIVSEYKPSTPNTRYNFPTRNRIIAGLSKGVLIIEASNKSGTMHTKEYAYSEGRDIFCIPGNINSRASAGTNWLIYSQQAYCTLNPEQILTHYYMNVKTISTAPKVEQMDTVEREIISLLEIEPREYQYLIDALSIKPNLLTTYLVKLEIKGKIKKDAGNIYRLLD